MPDQSSAAQEHALIQEITEPLNKIPDDAVQTVADAHFPTVLRGYDKFAVDDYVRETSQLVAELQSRSSPQAAVRRALERVGEDVSGILQRAHDTAEGITAQSRGEAEDRLDVARQEAAQITADARAQVKELDNDTDRIWAERDRIVADARELARQLLELADAAAARFPAADEPSGAAVGDTDSFAAAEPGDDGGDVTQPFTPLAEDEGERTEAFSPPDAGDPAADRTEVLPSPARPAPDGDVGPKPSASARPSGPFDFESPSGDRLPGELRLTPPTPRSGTPPRRID
jgi:hypothetical protein